MFLKFNSVCAPAICIVPSILRYPLSVNWGERSEAPLFRVVRNRKTRYIAEVTVRRRSHGTSQRSWYVTSSPYMVGSLDRCMCAVGDYATGETDGKWLPLELLQNILCGTLPAIAYNNENNCTNFLTAAQSMESLSLTRGKPAASAAGIAHFTANSSMPPSQQHMTLLILTSHSLHGHIYPASLLVSTR